MSGAEAESPPCHTVQMPRYAPATRIRMSALGLRRQTNGMNSAEAMMVNAQLRYPVTIEATQMSITACAGRSGLGRPASRSSSL